MKNTQRIILFQCFLALLIAHPVRLQAQGDYTGGDLDINADATVCRAMWQRLQRIDGNLTIGGGITYFP